MKRSAVSSSLSLLFSVLLVSMSISQLNAAEDTMSPVSSIQSTTCDTEECAAESSRRLPEEGAADATDSQQTFYYRLYMLLKLFNKQGS